MGKNVGRVVIAGSLGIGLLFYFGAAAQTPHRSPAILQAVNESKLVTLRGNVHPAVRPENDRGAVADDLRFDHLQLQLKRLPQGQAALDQFLAEQQDPQSSNYHKWLTAAQFGERFGALDQDVSIITEWLQSHGFTVNELHAGRMVIDFSGNAEQIRSAFHTEIHNIESSGERHIANVTDPQIPEALASAVEGIVSLHDFMPRPLNVAKSARPGYTYGSGSSAYQAVVPGDLATIYNFNPVFSSGNTGKGQTIVLIEDSDVYSTSDFTTFQSTFGLSSYGGSLVTVHPSGPAGTCADPGANGDDVESEIDVEWALAAAPGATIELASCASTRSTFGGFIALQNLLSSANPPHIISISYGSSESQLGTSGNAYINNLYSMAAGMGVSIFVSAGDEGAASSDAGAASASHGITVSGFASTPYNTAVGGTDFEDSYLGATSSYWNSTNGTYYNSAKSYIPEIPWNDSCASQLLANAFGYTLTYGATGFCASRTANKDGLLAVVGGSGGPSNCASGSASRFGGNTCQGYKKPSWQSVYGNPADNVRDIPDVSLFAANGIWGHYYVVCYSDPGRNRGGVPCTGAPSTWAGFGGTSVSSPIMAGIQALINAKTHQNWGVAASTLYSLARTQYGSNGASTCGASCVFNDVTAGDNDVNCTNGSPNCYNPNSTARNGGVLSTSTSSYNPAYSTARGWDFATGIGSVNVANLLANWP